MEAIEQRGRLRTIRHSQGTQGQSAVDIVSTPKAWPKRIAFLIVWALFLFGGETEHFIGDRFGPPWTSYVGTLTEGRTVLLLAVAVVILAARFRPGAMVIQGLYLWLFIPIALIYLVYVAVLFFLRAPSIARGLFTSFRVHAFLWFSATLAVVAILEGWEPRLIAVYLVIVLSSIAMLVATAFLFAFSPGAVHHAAARLMLLVWKSQREGAEKQLASGELAGDKSKIDAKVNELTVQAQFAEKAIRYFELAADRKTAIKLFVGILPFLFVLIALLFAVAFLGLEANVPGSLSRSASNPESLSLLDFFLFSVANMLNSGTSGVVPITHAARILSIFEVVSAVSIVVVLLLIVTTISPERHQEELREALKELQDAAHERDQLIERIRSLHPGS